MGVAILFKNNKNKVRLELYAAVERCIYTGTKQGSVGGYNMPPVIESE